jgi:hypothetical protein
VETRRTIPTSSSDSGSKFDLKNVLLTAVVTRPQRGRLLAEKGRENKSVNKMALSRFVRNTNMTQKYQNYRLKTTTNTYKNINEGLQSIL